MTASAITISAWAQGQFGTAAEARVMLDKAVAAVKADKAKALDHSLNSWMIRESEAGDLPPGPAR